MARFLKTEYQISLEEAQSERDDELAHIQNQIHELEQDYQSLAGSPLNTSRWNYERITPDHPEWENTPEYFDRTDYMGEWKFKNLDSLENKK